MNIPRFVASLCLFGLLAQPLCAAGTTDAALGTWTHDLSAAKKLADTYDRPLVVMFSNSSGKCPWCNRFETKIDSSAAWNDYASYQELAMAVIDYNVNWNDAYYQSVATTNSAITGFPAFVIYASNGSNVLSSFSYNSTSLTFTAAAFVDKINAVLSGNNYLLAEKDIWDPADNTAVGATILTFQAFNQRQYHDLNKTADDTDDWFKFLSVSGRKYKLQIPSTDYRIDFSQTITTNLQSVITNSSPASLSVNTASVNATTNLSSVVTNVTVLGVETNYFFFGVTNVLPIAIQLVTNALEATDTTNLAPQVASGSPSTLTTNLPSAAVRALTNGTPPELISPTITLLDPTRQTRLDIDAGPLGITNQLMITSLTNGCLFTIPAQYANSYCFLDVNQVVSNTPPSFSAIVYQPPLTNLTVSTTITNLSQTTVTHQTLSNVWFTITYTGPTNLFTTFPPPEDFLPALIISTNIVVEISHVTISNTVTTPLVYTGTNSIVTEGSNYVTYAYNRTQYTLNYRFWEPGEVGFSATNVQVSETAASVPLTVTRKGGSAGTVKLRYHIEDANTPGRSYEALAGQDFKSVEGELFWADGQTGSTNITVSLIQDLRPTWEGNERFAVVLTKHEDANYLQAPLSAASNAVVTLLESAKKNAGKLGFSGSSADESGPATPFANPDKPAVTVTEGDALTLWVARTGGSNGIVRAQAITVNGAAKSPVDFDALSQPLEWADGETGSKPVTLQTLDRAPFNRDMTFSVKLVNVLSAAVTSSAAVTVTLRDKLALASLADTAAAAAGAGAVFTAASGYWFWEDTATLRCEPLARGKTATLSLTLTGPGLLSFDWSMADWTSPDQIVCSGGVVVKKTLSAEAGASSVLVKPGRQTVTWTYTKTTASNADAYASMASLNWHPLHKAINPAPASGARTSEQDLSWETPDHVAVLLGGDFATNDTDLIDVTSSAIAVSPIGAAVSDATSVTFEDLWNTATPTYGRIYKWRVDTVFENEDGRLVDTGDVWSFTALNPDISEDTGFPGNSPDGLYEALQGVYCDFDAITEDAAITYALVGGSLPTGLKLNASTGQISGVPAKSGTWSALLQATSTATGSRVPFSTAALTFTVYPLGTFAGSYDGWTTTGSTNLSYSGSGSLAVTAAGALTAKFIVNGTTFSFSKAGFDETDNVEDPTTVTDHTCSGTILKALDGTHTNTLDNLVIDKDGTLAASLSLFTPVKNSAGVTVSVTQTVHRVELFRNDWGDATMKTVLSPFIGYYTVSLPVNDSPNETIAPWGSGYVTLTIASGGSVKLSGVLADGNAWSQATTLLMPDTNDTSVATVYVSAFPPAYANNGGFCGILQISAGADIYGNTVECPVGTTLQWWNFTPTSVFGATGTTVSASTGFLNNVNADGGYYDTIMNLQTYYLNKALTFNDRTDYPAAAILDRLPSDNDGKNGVSGYLLLSGVDEEMLPFGTAVNVGAQSLSVGAKKIVANGTDSATSSLIDSIDFTGSSNVSGLSLSLTRATGLIQGSFALIYERKNANGTYVRRTRTVAYKGVHTPMRPDAPPADSSAGVQGAGFYLIPDTGTYLDSTGRNKCYSFNWSFAFELFSVAE